jgi:hypothetical protein
MKWFAPGRRGQLRNADNSGGRSTCFCTVARGTFDPIAAILLVVIIGLDPDDPATIQAPGHDRSLRTRLFIGTEPRFS